MEKDETMSPEPEAGKNIAGELFDWLEIFVAALTAVFILFLFVGRVAVVDGSSMLPTPTSKISSSKFSCPGAALPPCFTVLVKGSL